MLEKYINEAVFDTFKKQFDIGIENKEEISVNENYYTSSIDIVFKDRNKTIVVYSSKDMLVNVASILLFEDNPDEDCLTDLNNEIANLVVGHAKVLASNDNYQFNIATPMFDGLSSKLDATLFYQSNMGNLIIGLNDGR